MPVGRLLVFAKTPVPGRVKTRLTPPLTPRQSADLYLASVRDVVAQVAAFAPGRLELWHDSLSHAATFFRREFPDVPRFQQAEGDLGARLSDAFDRSFASGAEEVVVLGSDAPTLPPRLLRSAARCLAACDLVLGPAEDGGYYLVGLRRVAWPRARVVFEGIPWSTADVFPATMARAAEADIGVWVGESWYDLDRPADVERAREHAAPDSRLAEWLRAHPSLTDRT